MKMRATIAALVFLVLPRTAVSSSCDMGKDILLREGVRLAFEISNDRADLDDKLMSAQAKLPPDQRRASQPYARGARLDLYTPQSLTKKQHPETSQVTIESVLRFCKAGDTLIVPYPSLNRVAIAELCDFSKSIVTTESAVLCAVGNR